MCALKVLRPRGEGPPKRPFEETRPDLRRFAAVPDLSIYVVL
jgi:hypothetical protein